MGVRWRRRDDRRISQAKRPPRLLAQTEVLPFNRLCPLGQKTLPPAPPFTTGRAGIRPSDPHLLETLPPFGGIPQGFVLVLGFSSTQGKGNRTRFLYSCGGSLQKVGSRVDSIDPCLRPVAQLRTARGSKREWYEIGATGL